jgi:hypothetical protein
MKRIYTFHGTRILKNTHQSTPLDPILSLINLVHNLAFYHFKGSLVFPSTTRSLNDLLSLGSYDKKCVYVSQHSHVYPSPLYLITLKFVCEEWELWSLLCSCCIASVDGPNVHFGKIFSNKSIYFILKNTTSLKVAV